MWGIEMRVRTTRRGRRRAVVVVAAAAVAGACVPPPAVPTSPIAFTEHVVSASVPGAAFVVAGDVLAGGGDELVVSVFGKPVGGAGEVRIFQRGADLDS